MKYFSATFFKNSWTEDISCVVVPGKNKTRIKRVLKEAFPNAILIKVRELDTPYP